MQSGQVAVSLARNKAERDNKEEDNGDWKLEQERQIKNLRREANLYTDFWRIVKHKMYMSRRGSSRLYDSTDDSKENTRKTDAEHMMSFVWTIHPDNYYKNLWDLNVGMFVVCSVMLTPFKIGFPQRRTTGSFLLDLLIDLVFFFDMIFNLNTAYYNINEDKYEFNKVKIALKYLSFWFWIDFISIIPFGFILTALGAAFESSSVQLFKIIRLVRLIRLVKLYRLTSWSEYLDRANISPSAVNLVILIGQVCFLCHLYACLWHYLALDEDISWLTEGDYAFEETSVYDQYVASLYFTTVTMLTIGYGDIVPATNKERVFAIFAMLTGGVVFGALLSKVALIIDKRNPQAKAFSEKMGEFKAFIEDKSLPLKLKTEAKDAYSYYLSKKSSYGEANILAELPKPILKSIIYKLYEDDIEKVEVFRTYDSNFVVLLVHHMRPSLSRKNDVLFSEGDVCNEISFITVGSISIANLYLDRMVITGYAGDGNFIGDFEYHKNTYSLATYTAIRNCTLLTVTHAIMTRACTEHFLAGKMFEEETRSRYQVFQKALAKEFQKANKETIGKINKSSLKEAIKKVTFVSRGFSTKPVASATQRLESVEIDETDGSAAGLSSLATAAGDDEIVDVGPPLTTVQETDDVDNSAGSDELLPNKERTACASPSGTNEKASRSGHDLLHSVANNLMTSSGVVGTRKSSFSKKANTSIHSRKFVWMDGKLVGKSEVEHLLSTVLAAEQNETATYKVFDWSDDDCGVADLQIFEVDRDFLNKRMIIHPSDVHKIYWDLVIAFLIVVSMLVIPVNIAFNAEALSGPTVDLISTIFFGIDLILSFRTAYSSKELEDAYIIQPRAITVNYLQTWFTIDFISTVPIDLILRSIPGSANPTGSSNKLVKILRIFRLLKLIRVLKFGKYIEKIEDFLGIPTAVFDLLKLGVQVYIVCHFVACIWWGMCTVISEQGDVSEQGGAWYNEKNFGNDYFSPGSQYIVSLYWTVATITSVGYGDITPINSSERILNIVIVLFGASIFGFMIANVTSVMDGFNKAETVKAERLDQIKEYLKEKECPRALGDKVLNHFRELFNVLSAFDEERILSCLPPSIKNQILLRMHKKTMGKIPLFRYVENKTVQLYLFEMMKPVFYQKGQRVFAEQDPGSDILFFIHGKVAIYKSTLPTAAKLSIKISSRIKRKMISWKKRSAVKKLSVSSSSSKKKVSPSKILPIEDSDDVAHIVQLTDQDDSDASLGGCVQPGQLQQSSNWKQEKRYEEKENDEGTDANMTLRHIFSKTSQMLKSFSSSHQFDEEDVMLETESDDFIVFSEWENKVEMEKRSLELICTMGSGNFVGHTALMNNTHQKANVVATAITSAYVISKEAIGRIVRIEPTVALSFQHALSLAIKAQNVNLENYVKTTKRTEFMLNMKKRFYKENDIDVTVRKRSDQKWKATTHILKYVAPMTFKVDKRSKTEIELTNGRQEERNTAYNKLEIILSNKNIEYDTDEDLPLATPPKIEKPVEGILTKAINSPMKAVRRGSIVVTGQLTGLIKLESSNSEPSRAAAGLRRCYSAADTCADPVVVRIRKSQPFGRRQSFPSYENAAWRQANQTIADMC